MRPSTAPVAGSKEHRRGLFAEQHALREEKVREKMRDDKKEQAPLARTCNHSP